VDSPNGLGVEATQKLEKLQTLTGETAEIQAKFPIEREQAEGF